MLQFLRTKRRLFKQTPKKQAAQRLGMRRASKASMDNDPDVVRDYKNGQDIRDRTFAFACRVVKFCEKLYEQGGVARLMAPQLVHCSTSTAAMLEEARAAESDADFLSKTSVSLKECRESWMRLRVCAVCKLGPPAEAKDLVRDGSELVAILMTIAQNKRRSMKAKAGRRSRAQFVKRSS